MKTSASAIFEDVIISATDLKTNQKKWFDQAARSPVSITNRGSRQFVLMNREHLSRAFLSKSYAENILQFCQEMSGAKAGGRFESAVYPWASRLSPEDRQEFQAELINTFSRLVHGGDWAEMDEVIASWVATAQALANRQFMDVVKESPRKRKFVEID